MTAPSTTTPASATAPVQTPPHKSMPLWQTVVMGSTGLLLLAFGLLTLDTAVSIWQGVHYLSLHLLSAIVSPDFTWGTEDGYAGLQQVLSQYYAKSGRMALHTAMGGIVVGIGLTQFVPALRRKHPRLHRGLGLVVASSMALSMAGAITYLVSAPLETIFSGPTFWAFLWATAILALFTLGQAALAIVSRDFRSHMVWMAICFASYLTAPILRLDWVLLGLFTPMSLQRANAAIAPLVLVQTLLLMQLWLSFMGDADLPARAPNPASPVPRGVLVGLAVLSGAIALHEGLLAPLGWGLLGGLRNPLTVLPWAASFWAVATVCAAFWSLAAWQAWLQGRRPATRFLLALALQGMAAAWVGLQTPRGSLDGMTWSLLWQGLGVVQCLVLLAALTIRPNSLGRNAWGMVGVCLLWLPVAALPLIGLLKTQGLSQYEALVAGTGLSLGGLIGAGMAMAMGAKLRLRPWRG